jgi:hypothetical protein
MRRGIPLRFPHSRSQAFTKHQQPKKNNAAIRRKAKSIMAP